MDRTEAQALASRIMHNKEVALDTLVREELGIDPGELGGDPWWAAGSSFALFAVGAIVHLRRIVLTKPTLAPRLGNLRRLVLARAH